MVVDTPGPPGPKPTAKGCPQLEPLREDECPDDGLVEYFSCDRIELHPGMLCKSRENECATDRGLNNCIYPSWDEGRTSDIYRVVGDSPA